MTSGGKLFKKAEAAKFFSVIIGLIALFIAIIAFLLKFPQLTTVWLASAGVFFMVRRTDSWKMGIECFYLLSFTLSYAFGLYFTLPLIYIVLIAVMKVRPDELNGCVVHSIILTGVALTARVFLGFYGINITEAIFIKTALGTIITWLFIDLLVAKKIAPVSLGKLGMIKIMNSVGNYFLITLFGFKLLRYFLSIA